MNDRIYLIGCALQGLLSNSAIAKSTVKDKWTPEHNAQWHAEVAIKFADTVLSGLKDKVVQDNVVLIKNGKKYPLNNISFQIAKNIFMGSNTIKISKEFGWSPAKTRLHTLKIIKELDPQLYYSKDSTCDNGERKLLDFRCHYPSLLEKIERLENDINL